MKIFTAMIALMLSAASAIAAPQPKPPIPLEIAFTQGSGASQVIRRLPILGRANCIDFRGTPVNGEHGLERFRLICGNTAQASYVTFNTDDGPVYPQWIYAPPPVCAPMPASVSQERDCSATNPGTTGTWVQTHGWAAASPQVPPDGCWVALPWTPTLAPPDACTPVQGGFQWQAPRPASTFSTPTKPPKGGSFVGPYGATETRVTDHATDAGGGNAWLREDYNRRESLNADDSLLLIYQPNGFWDVFDAHTNAFVKRLSGPAGDSEIQWDVSDPNALYFLPINGGMVLRKLDVAANTSSVQYDFTAAVTALWPTARRCWTKSEGSPSQDGRLWGLMCETDSFTPLGFVVLDVVAKTVVWSMPNSVRPDNVTISPSGRWFVRSGNDSFGTRAYQINGVGTWQLHPGVEHADLGVLPNGHDFIVTFDYTLGVTYVMDIDVGPSSRRNLFPIYNNAWLDNVPPHPCAHCAGHWSAKAYAKPGWAVFGSYGTPPANILVVNVVTGAFFGLAANYINDGDYFDEPHCFASRNLSKVFCNENFGASLTGDIYRIDVPTLP